VDNSKHAGHHGEIFHISAQICPESHNNQWIGISGTWAQVEPLWGRDDKTHLGLHHWAGLVMLKAAIAKEVAS